MTSQNYDLAAERILKFKFPSYYTMLLNYRVTKHQIISINQGRQSDSDLTKLYKFSLLDCSIAAHNPIPKTYDTSEMNHTQG